MCKWRERFPMFARRRRTLPAKRKCIQMPPHALYTKKKRLGYPVRSVRSGFAHGFYCSHVELVFALPAIVVIVVEGVAHGGESELLPGDFILGE